MRAFVILTILAGCAGWAVVHELPDAEAETGPSIGAQQVQSVSLDGQNLPFAALRSVLATHIGDELDDARLAADRAALMTKLVDLGYRDAKVSAPSIVFGEHGGAYVTFDVTQGQQYRVASLTITGTTDDDAKDAVTLSNGDLASPARIQLARAQLADALAHDGKPRVVHAAEQLDRAGASVDVELTVQ